jgi:hypothetical protein
LLEQITHVSDFSAPVLVYVSCLHLVFIRLTFSS